MVFRALLIHNTEVLQRARWHSLCSADTLERMTMINKGPLVSGAALCCQLGSVGKSVVPGAVFFRIAPWCFRCLCSREQDHVFLHPLERSAAESEEDRQFHRTQHTTTWSFSSRWHVASVLWHFYNDVSGIFFEQSGHARNRRTEAC